MANRHKHHKKARGGEMSARDDYAGSGEPNVVKEAKEKNHGGGVEMGKVHGHKGKHRIHKKRGGGIGADKSPFSSAAHGGMANSPAKHGHGEAHHGKKGFVGGHGG